MRLLIGLCTMVLLAACSEPEPPSAPEPPIPETSLRQPPPALVDPADIPEPLEEPADDSSMRAGE